MAKFPIHSYFRDSAEKFYEDETLSTPIKLLLSLCSLIQCHISIFNVYKTLIKTLLRRHGQAPSPHRPHEGNR